MPNLLETAQSYHAAGLCVLPAKAAEKRPALTSWKHYQRRRPTENQLQQWFTDASALCLLTGEVSGNLELLDFDQAGAAYNAWCERVTDVAPDLLAKLVIERSPSGGFHVVFRNSGPVPANQILATREIETSTADPVTLHGKSYEPRRRGERWFVRVTLIETRGQGGLFLCAPSPGYELLQGSFTAIPCLSTEERAILVASARSLSEISPPNPATAVSGRPGDDYAQRGDLRALLRKHGWECVREGDNEHWRRPGKTSGVSATLKDGVFYVFSTNAAPFESDQAYNAFAAYALLEHSGDYQAAASQLRRDGYGEQVSEVNIEALVPKEKRQAEPPPAPPTLSEHLLRVPGFVSEVMDLSLRTAPYPNVAMAFCGALALQAFLAGRKVCDPADNRPNIYLLALTFPSGGKDWPRKVNTKILHALGLAHCLRDRFASAEGLQDLMLVHPNVMFQTDEFDSLLLAFNNVQDMRYEQLLSTLLTLYSTSNSVFPMRPKAGKVESGVIDQPNLIILGTAVPTHYYKAMNERLLTNGFFARLLTVECGCRGTGQEPQRIVLPDRILETAHWWHQFQSGTGNLQAIFPDPKCVEYSAEARELLTESRRECEAEYGQAEQQADAVAATVWGRVNENTRKLALLYAVSENHLEPEISAAGVRWAREFGLCQARRMLFMARTHAAENPFHALCLRFLQKLRSAEGNQLDRSVLLKRLKCDAGTFNKLVTTLIERGDIQPGKRETLGRTSQTFLLVDE